MNELIVVLIVILVILFIIGCFAAIRGINKIDEEKANKKFKNAVNEIVQQMAVEFEDYLKTQEEDVQRALKDIQFQYEAKEQNVKSQIKLLDESLEQAKNRQQEQLKELEAKTSEIINNRAKIEAAQMQSVIDFYQNEQNLITKEFNDFKDDIDQQRREILEELNEQKKRQSEIIAQYKQAEEIKKNSEFYRITISENEKSDIKKLKDLSYSLSKPEILLKLIYETYYKTKLEELFKRVLGDNKNSAGIYKITNIENNKTYIGKTTSLISRWRIHAKRGCGIERINGLLYDAMFEEGLENFTWEVISLCDKDELTEKEKEMIEFYKSNEYGYNIRKG